MARLKRVVARKPKQPESSSEPLAHAKAKLKRKASDVITTDVAEGSAKEGATSGEDSRSSYGGDLREDLGANPTKRLRLGTVSGPSLDYSMFKAVFEQLKQLSKDVAQLNGIADSTHTNVLDFDDHATNEQAGEMVEKLDDLDDKAGEIVEKLDILDDKVDNVESNLSKELDDLATFHQAQCLEENLAGLDDKVGEVADNIKGAMDDIGCDLVSNQRVIMENQLLILERINQVETGLIMENQQLILQRINRVESGLQSMLCELANKIHRSMACTVPDRMGRISR